MGLSWASHSHGTLIYFSELILWSTFCVHSATRHNIHMYPHLNSGAKLLLELYRVAVIKRVALVTIWVKLTINNAIHMYQFTFEPLHLCFWRWLWFRI